ncbi:MAG TPA: hypothetical protein VGQ84_07170, partial [Gaiellaceae bacterium]|nr:hypothetical protein [Gaiellaceae bacterium]
MVELGLAVGYHTALGLLLAALVWIAGAGVLALLQRPHDPRSLLDAYPFGLLVAIAAATLPLLCRPLAAVSTVAVVALLWLGLRHGLPRVLSRSRLALALVGCAGCGAGLGALLHGPTDELDSSAYGGMLFYVDKVVSAAQTIDPFRDLLAEGERIIYAEAGTSFAGAALSWLPGFDPVLYNA